jgi:multiple sugar transport system substrate-binding protein
LFDIETMRPLIAQPPFVRALEELRDTLEPLDLPPVDPAGALELLLDGHAAMALTWATATDLSGQRARGARRRSPDLAARPTVGLPKSAVAGGVLETFGQTVYGVRRPAHSARLVAFHNDTIKASPPAIGVAQLPGSRDVYSADSRSWETRIEGSSLQVPTIGLTGRIGSVTRSTRNAPTAMQLLAWLSGPELSAQVSPASRATTLFRRAHLAAPGVWVPAATGAALAHDYANLVAKILDHEIWLGGLRIPAADQYVAALDDAVRKALAGAQTPAAALAEAAGQWQVITQKLGLAAQKKAYAASLGL